MSGCSGEAAIAGGSNPNRLIPPFVSHVCGCVEWFEGRVDRGGMEIHFIARGAYDEVIHPFT